MDLSAFGSAHPVGELHVVRHGSTEHDDSNMLWQHNEGFLPDHSSLLVVDVVHLVEYHPFDITDHISPFVKAVA